MRVLQLVCALSLLGAVAADCQDRPRRDRNLITREEIVASGSQTPYDAVRKLRPFWLSSRGAVTLQPGQGGTPVSREEAMVVYVDGVRRGGLGELRMLSLTQVNEMRFYSAEEATTRFGLGHPYGAIEVQTGGGE